MKNRTIKRISDGFKFGLTEYGKVLVRAITGIFKRPISEMKNPNINPILGLIKGIYGVQLLIINNSIF